MAVQQPPNPVVNLPLTTFPIPSPVSSTTKATEQASGSGFASFLASDVSFFEQRSAARKTHIRLNVWRSMYQEKAD
jgi:hypothetical protein